MNEDAFWALLEASRDEARRTGSRQDEFLASALRKLSARDVLIFDEIFFRHHEAANRWELWAAAELIGDGCSDDGFTDFRSALIGLGKDVYTRAIADPDTLADLPTRGVDLWNESLAYAARKVYLEKTGSEVEYPSRPPADPLGKRVEQKEWPTRFPRLVGLYGSDR